MFSFINDILEKQDILFMEGFCEGFPWKEMTDHVNYSSLQLMNIGFSEADAVSVLDLSHDF